MRRWIVLAGLALAAVAQADDVFPKPEWRDAPDPIASPNARPGGEMVIYAGEYPHSFNYYLDNNTFTLSLFSGLYENLLELDSLTAEFTPALARQWSISDDRRTFTFWIDEHARWSDGRPVTADDVVWTYNTVMDPKNLTGSHKVALETFEPPVAVATNVVRFTAREVHWRNLLAAGTFHILPRHAFEKADFNKVNFEFPVFSGPYRLGEAREGISVKMERRTDWWRATQKRVAGTGNFQTLTFRFFAERENAFEAFKKGEIDLYPVYTARMWINETQGEKFEKNWIIKQKIVNRQPIGFQGFAMNMRRAPFDDRRVRQAMAHMLDRERLNTTLMYSQYFMHRSYVEDLYSPDQPCRNPLFDFNKDRARALLKEAGWEANPKTGLQEKDGKPFAFTFLNRDESSNKFLAIYKEDLKDVGIEMKIEMKDWAAWSKDMDEFNFEMTWASWSSPIFKDPEDMWASKEAERKGGNNITGFKDSRVDALIEKQRAEFDVSVRQAIGREIDAIAAEACPYVLLWNINYVRLLYWGKFGTPPTVLSKFGDERSAYTYWWYDEDAAEALKQAVEAGTHLPRHKDTIAFDDVMKVVGGAAAATPPATP